jgi:hypothetical protein
VGRPRVRLSSQPRCGWRVPPADRFRFTAPNCSHPRKLRPGRGRRAPPSSLTQTPPLLRVFVVAPEQLSPAHRARPRAPPSPQLPCGRQRPPQIGSAQAARRTAPTRALLSLIADGDLPTHKTGWDAPETAVVPSSVPPSRPPIPRATHPFSFPPPTGPATCRGIPDLSPALRPGSCPPLAPAGAAQTQVGSSGKRALPEPRPARHSPPPGCA